MPNTKPALPAVLEEIELGPACQKLSAKRLRFAAALVFEVPVDKDAATEAGKIAGYATTTARTLMRDKAIIAAIEELARNRIALDVPLALDALKSAMTDRFGKDKIKAAQIILDRVVPVKQELKIEAVTIDRTQQSIDYLAHLLAKGATEEFLLNEFGPAGLERYRRMLAERERTKPIEVAYEVIEEKQAAPASPEPSADESDDDLGDIL